MLLGRGDGRFQEAPSSPVPAARGASAVAAGDLDGDGYDDLVVTAYVANRVTLIYGGPGEFRIAGFDLAENPWGVWAGDLDGDGRSDFAVARQGSDEVSIFLSGPRSD